MYHGFDIGSAKLPVNERRGIPHHLIDVREPGQLFTAGDFARMARTVLHQIAQRNRLPVLAGGTGFYLRALLEGLPDAPERQEPVRARLLAREKLRPGSLHRILARLDPAAADRIHQNDMKKLVRALEMRIVGRRPSAALLAEPANALTGFEVVKIGLDPARPELYRRIDERVAAMFQGGLIEEVQGILASGIPASAKPFESIGYAQVAGYLEGRLSFEAAVALAQQATRQYAKRQMTWFRRELNVRWFKNFGNLAEVQWEAASYLRDTIK